MNSSDYKITLDVHSMSAPISLNVKKGDTGRRICISLMESGVPYSIAQGCYAVFAGKKPDDKILWNACTIEGDTIIYDITAQTTNVVGWFSVQIRLYGAGGKLICSPDFVLIVDSVTVEDEELVSVSEHEVTALTELVTEFTTLKQELADAKATVTEIDLLAANWVGEESPYSQVVEIEGVNEYSQVDLTPSVEQLAIFHDKDLAFVAENEDGVVTVYVIGDKPANDYTMQVTIMGVNV